MCTLAFLATDDGGYIVGHNRDESRARGRGEPPTRRTQHGRAILAPRDPDAGGSWIGVNDAGVTMCVLNAAEPEGRVLPDAPRSRGLVLFGLLHLESIDAVKDALRAEANGLESVRSFQLVIAEPGDGRPATAVAMLWNGSILLSEKVDPPAIRVSSTRHLAEASLARQASWLGFLISRPSRDVRTLASWLASHEPSRGPLSVCMHREEARTVCRTIVEVRGATRRMSYHDGPPCEPGLELTPEL